jgi:hypothetical protein
LIVVINLQKCSPVPERRAFLIYRQPVHRVNEEVGLRVVIVLRADFYARRAIIRCGKPDHHQNLADDASCAGRSKTGLLLWLTSTRPGRLDPARRQTGAALLSHALVGTWQRAAGH